MDYLEKYNVNLKSLPEGKHTLSFEIDNEFFEHFEYSEIHKGTLTVTANIAKMSNSAMAEVAISGTVVAVCDRCLDDVELPVDFAGTLLVKYGEPLDDSDDNDETLYIGYGEDNVNLAQYFYESICLSLPIQRVHATEDECNKEMIEKLKTMMRN